MAPQFSRPNRSTVTILLVAGALTLTAAPLRLIDLGSLGFYADEETSAMPARALAEGNGPRIPNGMQYRRALPLTWLNAAAARAIGTGNDVAYRLPAALLGICAVPLLFLAGCHWMGRPAGMVAGLGLAVSEWYLAFSRQSRMYVPFLAFFVAAGWAIWNWAETGRRRSLYVAIPPTLLTVTLHQLGILVVLLAGLGFGYYHFFVSAGIQAWPQLVAGCYTGRIAVAPAQRQRCIA